MRWKTAECSFLLPGKSRCYFKTIENTKFSEESLRTIAFKIIELAVL